LSAAATWKRCAHRWRARALAAEAHIGSKPVNELMGELARARIAARETDAELARLRREIDEARQREMILEEMAAPDEYLR
jgi:hypothetical protein